MNAQQTPTYSPMTTIVMNEFWHDINRVMVEWQAAKRALDAAKTREMNLRQAIFDVRFPGHSEGTTRVELGAGYFLKAVGKLNYNLDNKDGATERALEEMETLGNEGKFLADRLVKWQPELSISEYRKLDPKYKVIISKVLTIKPGAPTLEIEEPEAKA